jgi:hypothetical protein
LSKFGAKRRDPSARRGRARGGEASAQILRSPERAAQALPGSPGLPSKTG